MTDRWTDRQNYDSQDRANIAASCGKNDESITNIMLAVSTETVTERSTHLHLELVLVEFQHPYLQVITPMHTHKHAFQLDTIFNDKDQLVTSDAPITIFIHGYWLVSLYFLKLNLSFLLTQL